MAISVTHATVATGTDAGNGEIRKAQWNEAHTVTGVPDIVARSATAQTIGAVTTETVLATVTIPGGAMGPNGWLEVWTTTTVTNGANNKTLYVRVGGTGGTAVANPTVTTQTGLTRCTIIANRNSQSSQIALAPGGNSSGSPGVYAAVYPTATLDTSANWDLVISGQKQVSGDTFTLEAYMVLLYYGA